MAGREIPLYPALFTCFYDFIAMVTMELFIFIIIHNEAAPLYGTLWLRKIIRIYFHPLENSKVLLFVSYLEVFLLIIVFIAFASQQITKLMLLSGLIQGKAKTNLTLFDSFLVQVRHLSMPVCPILQNIGYPSFILPFKIISKSAANNTLHFFIVITFS